MRTRVATHMGVVRRYFPAQYLAPIAVLLTLSFSCLFGLLFHLTSVQDRMERERQLGIVSSVTRSALRLADHDLRDYAIWDEAVVRLVKDFDPVWADDNLGPYLVGEQDYDYVFVLTRENEPVYAYGKDKGQVPAADLLLGPAFASSLSHARSLPAHADPLITGYSRAGDAVYVFAISRIVPLTGKTALPPGSKHVIAIARRVDAAFFSKMLEGRDELRLQLSLKPPSARTYVALYSPASDVLANLNWLPSRPGTALRNKIIPAFILVGLVCFVVAGMIVRRGRRSLEALRFSENRARHLASHDLLTGLPNRRAVQLHLQKLVDDHHAVCLLYMDLDGFKETNDVYGHGAGDGLLKAVAARLNDTVPTHHMLARVGGDEFAIAIAAGEGEALDVASSILSAFASPFIVGEYRVSLGVSIGVATKASRVDADELVRRADSAMYAAKAQGKHCFQIYSPVLDAGRERRKQLETDLRRAIERNEIGLVYQPIVCAHSRDVVAVEALARWLHPTDGLIPPDQFIPIAESSGLIVELGRAILMTACGEAREWKVDLAVNLSPAQFWDRSLGETITGVLNATNFPPERLTLEVTEGYLMRRPEAAKEILERLKRLGVRIALDDFGTGFASIGYLERLGFDSIKIDKSFIAASVTERRAADLATAMIAIGDALGVPVTAEGVETNEQAEMMRKAGCSCLQGWLFGRPVPASEMDYWFSHADRQAS